MKKAAFVRLFVLVSALCLLAACPDPSSPSGSSSAQPKVTSVFISAGSSTVDKGGTVLCTAVVAVEGGAAKTVSWQVEAVSGSKSGDTVIAPAAGASNQATLTVAADESASQLRVTAVSTVDSAKSHTITINVTDPANPPVVTAVLVYPKDETVNKGGQKTFTADVTVSNNAPNSVDWTLTGNNSAGTSLAPLAGASNQAVLTVAADESAASLTITATATHINAGETDGKSDSATVQVNGTGAGGGVTIVPAAGAVAKGRTLGLSVQDGGAADFTWSIAAPHHTDTVIEVNASNSHEAALKVAFGETASSLTISASAAGTSGSAVVTINPIGNIWITGALHNNYWTLPGVQMTESGGVYTFEGEIAPEGEFRFSLSDGSLAGWTRDWLIPQDVTGSPPRKTITIGTPDAPFYFMVNGDTNDAWKIPSGAGYYKIILNPGQSSVTVEYPVSVTGVTITSPGADTDVIAGESYVCTAQVSGNNTGAVTPVWSLVGSYKPGTQFTANTLSIAADEDQAVVTIRASAGGVDSPAINLNVRNPADYGSQPVTITIEDKGNGLAMSGGIPPLEPCIYKTGGSPGEDAQTFTVDNPDGGSTYTWRVDGGEAATGTSLTVSAAGYGVGHHTVRLTVTINGVVWSLPQALGFTVQAVKQ